VTTFQFNRLLEEYGSSLYGFCCYLTRSKQEAEDLYQETWLKAWERCRQIEAGSSPQGFLLSLAMGIWKNRRRKQERRKYILPQQAFPAEEAPDFPDRISPLPEDSVIKKEQVALLRQAILSIDDKWRIPLYLYYGQELSVKEIASLIKIPSGTVKSRLSKARELLRRQMEEHGYEMD